MFFKHHPKCILPFFEAWKVKNMNSMMSVREKSTKRFEGLRLKTYQCSAGRDTIGWGHNLEAKGMPPECVDLMRADGHGDWQEEGITLSIAALLFDIDARDALEDCRKLFFTFDYLTEIQQAVLFDMAFQLGCVRLKKFKNLQTAVNMDRFHEVPYHILDSKYAREDTPTRAMTNAAMWANDCYLDKP